MAPFQQIIRINILRGGFLLLLPAVLVFHPALDETLLGEAMEQVGVLLIIAAVIGRFWSILYIGGHKNRTLMQTGPYSICRHPLYLFSTLGVLGFGLMLQGLVFAVLMTLLTWLILDWTARKEEAFLAQTFGASWDAYAARTPRILPDLSLFRTRDEVVVNLHSLKGNFFDALVFVALIPAAEAVEWFRESGFLVALTLY